MASIKYLIALMAAVALIIGGVVLYLHRTAPAAAPSAAMPTRTITIDSTPVAVDVADTEDLREQGLSGRTSLAQGQGMLFVFDEDGAWGIWMKDMHFALDIVWADASGTVITVAQNVSPETYHQEPPQVFYPTAPARYVVELPAGFAAAHAIAEGSKIVL